MASNASILLELRHVTECSVATRLLLLFLGGGERRGCGVAGDRSNDASDRWWMHNAVRLKNPCIIVARLRATSDIFLTDAAADNDDDDGFYALVRRMKRYCIIIIIKRSHILIVDLLRARCLMESLERRIAVWVW